MIDPLGLKARILIIGAGPVGLTAALELARHGFSPSLIDKRTNITSNSRAVIVHSDVIRKLEPCGAGAGIFAEAVNIPNVDVFRDGKHAARFRVSALGDPNFRVLGIAQDRFEMHLINSLDKYGINIRRGAECRAISQDANKVTVQINQDTETFDYVIATDGVQSFVRNSLGVDFPGFDLPDLWSVADVNLDGVADPEFAKIYILPDGHVATAVPMGKDRYRITSNKENAVKFLPAGINVVNVNSQGVFNVAVRQAERYSVGRVFLAGDAAHCHSPVDGRGMNLGIGDAVDLAKRFENNTLDGYHAHRHEEGRYVICMTELIRSATTCKRGKMRRNTLIALKAAHYLGFLNRFSSRLATHNEIRSNPLLRRSFRGFTNRYGPDRVR